MAYSWSSSLPYWLTHLWNFQFFCNKFTQHWLLMASVVRCFPAPFFFLLVFLLGTFPSPPLLLHPPAPLLAKPFLKPILNAISPTYNLLLWLYFLIIPLMGWNSSRFYPFSLYTVRLSHTIPQLQQVSWGKTSPLTLFHIRPVFWLLPGTQPHDWPAPKTVSTSSMEHILFHSRTWSFSFSDY